MGLRGVAAGANPSLVSGRGQGTPWISRQLIAGQVGSDAEPGRHLEEGCWYNHWAVNTSVVLTIPAELEGGSAS